MARIPRVTRGALTQTSGFRPQAGEGWAALATAATHIESVIRPIAMDEAKKAGANSVYRDEEGNLRVDEKSLLGGELSAAHNTAAFAAYLGQSRVDVRQTLTELRTRHMYDPAAFKSASDAYIKKVIENSPPALRADVRLSAESEAVSMFDGLRMGQIKRDNSRADKTSLLARSALAEDVVALIQGGASWDDPRVLEKVNEIGAITAFRSNSAFINETEAEGKKFIEGVRSSGKVARFMRDIEDLGGADNISDEDRERLTKTIEDPDIDPGTREKMHRVLNGTLKTIDARSFVRSMTSDRYEDRIGTFGVRTNDAMAPALSLDGRESRKTTPEAGRNMAALLKTNFDTLQKVFGAELTINDAIAKKGTSRERKTPGSQHFHGKALDISLAGMSDSDRIRLVRAAREAGFTGFGFGQNILHVDVGPSRSWSYKNSTFGGLPVSTVKAMVAGAKGGAAPVKTDAATRQKNQDILTGAGLPLTPGNEAIVHRFGKDVGTKILQGDPEATLGEILGTSDPMEPDAKPRVAEKHASLPLDKKVGDIIQEANKHMAGPSSSDITEMRRNVDDIPDAEVRDMANRELNNWYAMKKQSEAEASESYKARIAAGGMVTRQEIMSDFNLDDGDQAILLRALDAQNKASNDILNTLSRLNDENYHFLPGSTKDRNAVDSAYRHIINGADPLSEGGQAAAAQIIAKAGFAPKSFYSAVKGALSSNDPARVAMAMGIAEEASRQYPNAFSAYGRGGKELNQDIAEYRHELRKGGGGEVAAERMVERRTPEYMDKARQRAGEAKKYADSLTPEDLVEGFDDQWPIIGLFQSDPKIMSQMLDPMMAMFRREAERQFVDTGDKGVATERALAEVGRVFGPSNVGGKSGTIMRLPPENFYPAINGDHEWITRQLVEDVSTYAETEIDKGAIHLQSDDETQADINAGRPPSYIAWYTKDGKLERMKDRFYADIGIARADLKERKERFDDRERIMEEEAKKAAGRGRDTDKAIIDNLKAVPDAMIEGKPLPIEKRVGDYLKGE